MDKKRFTQKKVIFHTIKKLDILYDYIIKKFIFTNTLISTMLFAGLFEFLFSSKLLFVKSYLRKINQHNIFF